MSKCFFVVRNGEIITPKRDTLEESENDFSQLSDSLQQLCGITDSNLFKNTHVEEPKNTLAELGTKIVNIDLIEIKDKAPVANVDAIDAYILSLTNYVDDAIEKDLDVEVIIKKKKIVKGINDNAYDYRLSFTKPLTGLVTIFTGKEKKMKEQYERLVKREKEMLESTYQIIEDGIKSEFDRLQSDNDNIVPNMDVFNSFISKQREVIGMLPNDKGVLGTNSIEKISKEFELHVKPIRDAQELEKLKAQEQKQFEMYLENLNVKSDNIPELEAVVINLEQFKNQVDELYPNIKESCNRTIENKIGLAKSNINTLEIMQKQKEAEEAQRKAEAEKEQAVAEVVAINNLDDAILTEMNSIESGLEIISDDKDLLAEKLERLRVLVVSMKYKSTFEVAEKMATTIKTMIADIKMIEDAEQSGDEEILEVDFRVTDSISKIKLVKQFMLDNNIKFGTI